MTFALRSGGAASVGAADGEGRVLDLSALAPDMTAFIAKGAAARARAQEMIDGAGARDWHGAADVRLLAPIPAPAKNILCVGKNYHAHAREFQGSGFDKSSAGTDVPDLPIIFTKPSTSVIGPGDPVPSGLDPTRTTDYEGELAVVIGPGGRTIAAADAFDHVYGYTIINDVTAREIQRRHAQWFLGKSLDGFCPMGPAIVTADEVGDVAELRLTTRVNGELRQDARVGQLIFDIPTLIETLSLAMTLDAGDIISTGTPEGVGIGFTPPKYLKPGDVVTIEIDRLGVLENPIA
ncbi:MAG: fumarylacetoacetate hydrolase family protein [Alphaproteobacteria bacterium]|nr:fumarylacetoacetate hydrolase family protein [Alphaproteobacteria bacterium]